MRVLICGGGVIGASIAYFLSRRGVAGDRSSSAPASPARRPASPAASWRSTGATAVRWQALARRSFALHAEPRRGARRRLGLSPPRPPMAATPARAADARRRRDARRLAVGGVVVDRRLGSTDTTAQVHPGAFTAAMMRAAQAQGAELRHRRGHGRRGRAGRRRVARRRGRRRDRRGRRGGHRHGAVVDAGARWLPLPAVFGLKGHSLVFETGAAMPARGALPRIPGGERRHAVARGVPARRRHHLCLRHLQRKPAAGRPRRRGAGPRRDRAPAGDVPRICRRRSPARRCWPARPASARSPRTGCR